MLVAMELDMKKLKKELKTRLAAPAVEAGRRGHRMRGKIIPRIIRFSG